ncbi:conserved hypothetical protein [Perkinsus marinus ATCC 50983]|uniref:Uncharacterized protein n=2 Tax=Perkinsus marinus (strain ATCC 50983 / TXsc) TaxID=423536 RepID=C5K4P7_PERM5|nr:conserved hypothetical protein [Perkinsus marinus ATCC 50983]EER20319.1 conserved hypothetical protein [Perkinsus marinus ATCC 50983]|eukprot:XP_002788523.1 conserved hypothetical protein [Perkinsus marinus ATCC 50983]
MLSKAAYVRPVAAYSAFGRTAACQVRHSSSFTNGMGFGITIPQLSGPGGVFVTKYKITRPYNENTTWDDLLLYMPERDQLAKFTKDVPLFIRYLKLVTDQEGRKEAFREFYQRCKDGLTVENDIFLTTDELLALMWKNGYTEKERNAIQATFPSDYRFHYPELSVLFDVPEEDTYKFCLRSRMEKSHIGELDYDKVKRKGFLRDHWLIFAGGWYIFKNFPFYNYLFYMKTYGFSLWFVSCWYLFSRMANRVWRRNEFMAEQKTAAGVMEGEDKILKNMSRFTNDSMCVNYLKAFKRESTDRLAQYRHALIQKQKHDVTDRVLHQLQNIERSEHNIAASMQEILVRETASSFRDMFPTDPKMQQESLNTAIAQLAGDTVDASKDPVKNHFVNSFKDLKTQDVSKATADAKGTLIQRLAFDKRRSERDFERQYMVTKAEADEVRSLAKKAKGKGGYDWSILDATDMARLEELYTKINNKVGFPMLSEAAVQSVPVDACADLRAKEYTTHMNEQLEVLRVKLRNERLNMFAAAF